MIETSGHLPECPWADRGYAFPCICDRLRACEQRVLEDQAWVDHAREIEAHARSLALNAAREVVAGQCGHTKSVSSIYQCDHDRAVAAIDALRATNP